MKWKKKKKELISCGKWNARKIKKKGMKLVEYEKEKEKEIKSANEEEKDKE